MIVPGSRDVVIKVTNLPRGQGHQVLVEQPEPVIEAELSDGSQSTIDAKDPVQIAMSPQMVPVAMVSNGKTTEIRVPTQFNSKPVIPVKNTKDVGRRAFLSGLAGGFAGTTLTFFGISLLLDFQQERFLEGQVPPPNGQELNSLDPQKLIEIEKLRTELQSEMNPAIETLSERRIKVGKVVKPSTVLIGDQMLGKVLGSGYIYKSEGIIVTNAHVVNAVFDTNDRVMVGLYDGRMIPGSVVAKDNAKDIALIKINVTGLPALPFAKEDPEAGTEVLGVSFQPPSWGWSMSSGIVSAKDRPMIGCTAKGLQTDVAINPGSSGSPLVNLKGEVVGLNSQWQGNLGYQELGFSIQKSELEQVISRLLNSAPGIPGRNDFGF